MMLLSGYFATSDNIAPFLKPLEYISAFKFSYQSLADSEFNNIQPLNCVDGSDVKCNPLENRFKFPETSTFSVIVMASVALCFKFFAFLIIFFKSKVKAD